MDFVEDVELLEALNYYVDIEKYCPTCLYELDQTYSEIAKMFSEEGERFSKDKVKDYL